METRFNAASSDATATGTGAWAANFPCSLMLPHELMLSKSKLAPRCELRVTLVHAPDTTSLRLLREFFFSAFWHLWQQLWASALQSSKEERAPRR